MQGSNLGLLHAFQADSLLSEPAGKPSGYLAPGLMPPMNSLVIDLFPVFKPRKWRKSILKFEDHFSVLSRISAYVWLEDRRRFQDVESCHDHYEGLPTKASITQ